MDKKEIPPYRVSVGCINCESAYRATVSRKRKCRWSWPEPWRTSRSRRTINPFVAPSRSIVSGTFRDTRPQSRASSSGAMNLFCRQQNRDTLAIVEIVNKSQLNEQFSFRWYLSSNRFRELFLLIITIIRRIILQSVESKSISFVKFWFHSFIIFYSNYKFSITSYLWLTIHDGIR